MRLFHGTSSRSWDSIQRHGLRPRKPGTRGNWPKAVSGSDRVYLTDSYAIHYAMAASNGKADALVLEIDPDDLNPLRLVPDEDFLEQVTRGSDEWPAVKDKPMPFRTRYFRDKVAPDRPDLAELSMDHLGTCAHMGPIQAKAIKKAVLIPSGLNIRIIMGGHDPTVTILHRKILRERYQAWMRWVMLEDVDDFEDDIQRLTGQKLEWPPRDELVVLR